MFLSKVLYNMVYIISAIAASRLIPLKRLSSLNGKSCSANSTLFEHQFISGMECSSVCTFEPQCYSVFYNNDTQTCRGCNDSYFDELVTVEDIGFVGYQKGQCI